MKTLQILIRHRPALGGGKQCTGCYGWGFTRPDGTNLPLKVQIYRVTDWSEIRTCRRCGGSGRLSK